ncbi:MAG: four helix bundle protein [Cytophagales bacterium]|nr:four helix bundle protein [Cytophagales bacterium]
MAVQVCLVTKRFPSEERFALVPQMNRCAVSIASNIAEGAGKNNTKEFNNFLGIASGSSCELETQLVIAGRLGYLSDQECQPFFESINEIQKMIYNLQKTLQPKIDP